MRDDKLHTAIRLVRSGMGPSPIDRALSFALAEVGCETGAVLAMRQGSEQLVTGTNIPFSMAQPRPMAPALREFFSTERVVERPSLDVMHADFRQICEDEEWEAIASIPIPISSEEWRFRLLLCENDPKAFRHSRALQGAYPFCTIIADELGLIAEIGQNLKKDRRKIDLGQISDSVKNSEMRVALVDSGHKIQCASGPLRASFKLPLEGSYFEDVFASKNHLEETCEFIDEQLLNGPSSRQHLSTFLAGNAPVKLRVIRYSMFDRPFLLVFFDEDRHALMANSSCLSSVPLDESCGVLTKFLADTIIKQTQVKSRSGVSYHAIARWRKSIKSEQVAALRAAKSDPRSQLVELAATQLVEGANKLFGSGSFDKVTHVACGHSGSNCFAKKLAQSVARQFDKDFDPVFEPIDITGSSHPRTNVNRKRPIFTNQPFGRYLLVDDVATSGAHIVEATNMLRGKNVSVSPLAWLTS